MLNGTLNLARRAGAFVALVITLLAVPLVACADATTTTSGRTLVVSPSGSDTDAGTADAPWRTLTKALPSLRPGDTLLVRGGTYPERLRSITITPATQSAPITVRAFPGERPVIEGLLWLRNASYWTLDGINVTWSAANVRTEHMVKFTDGVGWSFVNAEVWGARSFAGILVYGNPDSWRLADLHVHDTIPSNDTNEDHLIYVNTSSGTGIIERSLLTGSPNGRAVKIGGADPSGAPVGGVIVRYNTMYDNTGPSSVQFAWTSTNNLVERNIMVKPKVGRSAVTTFELSGGDNVVRENIAWQTSRVLDVGVAGLIDGGGNALVDPQFVNPAAGDFRTTNPAAAAYGRYAPESSSSASTMSPTIAPGATSLAAPPMSQPIAASSTSPGPSPTGNGYRLVARDGGIFSFGDAPFLGSTGHIPLNQPIVGMTATPDGNGYWLVASDGGIFAFGSAPFFGSTGAMRLNQPIVGMAATPDGRGYWLVASDGGIFSFGDARFHGSTGAMKLNRPIVGMASTANAGGYWLVATDGGLFSFGAAGFHGSAAGRASRVVGVAATPDGDGYWLAGEGGDVHAFGSAAFFGAGSPSSAPVTGIARTASGDGYWLTARDGSVRAFGSAPNLGSIPTPLNQPIVGMGALR